MALFSDIVRAQDMVRHALVSTIAEHIQKKFPAEWRAGLCTLPLTLLFVYDQPVADMTFQDGLAAMMATVTIDKAWGAKYLCCLRCGGVYHAKTRHERKYCSYRCAHAAAEQDRRDKSKRTTRRKSMKKRRGK
jgi:hypothetical protein